VYRPPPGVRLVGRPVMMRTRPPKQDRPTRLWVTASGTAGLVMAVLMGVIGGMGPRDTATRLTRGLFRELITP
jgi:hypothetical protein